MSETPGEYKSPYMAVPCPSCGAKVGRWCKRPSGHSGPAVAFHAARRQAAKEAEAAGGVRLETPAARGTVRWALDASRRVGNMWPSDTPTLCLTRMDDFYNAFDADAAALAEALDVAMTRIYYDGRGLAMTDVLAGIYDLILNWPTPEERAAASGADTSDGEGGTEEGRDTEAEERE